EGRRLTDMVEQVLAFAGASAPERRRPVEVETLLRAAAAEARLEAAGIAVTVEVAPGLCITGDEAMPAAAVRNLPANLRKAAAGPGVVVARTDRLRSDGYEVAVARDGDAGLLRASAEAFDLVLLDAMLPRKSGFDVLRELRARGVATPVLMLTARGQVADKV